MTADDNSNLSKFLSFILRHKPDTIGLSLDAQGWASIDELVNRSHIAGRHFSRDDLFHVIETSKKRRFTLSADAKYIRAAQGHSIKVNLGLKSQCPPTMLYHGTAERFLHSIMAEGLKPQSRQQVHLSSDESGAYLVGQRHGRPVVLTVWAGRMHSRGFEFFVADNGVWLTDHVPREFLGSELSDTADSATTSIQPKPSR